MIYFFIPLVLIFLYQISFHFKAYNKEYMSKENTTAIKGIFIIFVFFSHIRQYQTYNAGIDIPVIETLDFLGQLMVAIFMFYSGFGIFESIKKKGQGYIKNLPKKRVAKVMFELGIAVISFIICNLCVGKSYGIWDNILAFTAWSNIGNSNWYIFSIVSLYFTTYISFIVFKNKAGKALILNTVLAIAFISGIAFARPAYWVNTCLCYMAGMWYSYYLDRINDFFSKHTKLYYAVLIGIVAIFIGLHAIKDTIVIYSIMSIVFCLAIVIATMRINVKSKILIWFGKNLFWIYVLQRIPMIVFEKVGLDIYNKYIYFAASFTVTMLLTYGYSKLVPKLEKVVFRENKKIK